MSQEQPTERSVQVNMSLRPWEAEQILEMRSFYYPDYRYGTSPLMSRAIALLWKVYERDRDIRDLAEQAEEEMASELSEVS